MQSSLTPSDLDIWNEQKKKLQGTLKLPTFKQWEIWWCSIGKNVGREVYGKWTSFARPVYIFKKVSKEMFLGIPLTSQEKTGSWWYKIETHDKTRYAVLPQIRLLSANRLKEYVLILPEPDQENLKIALKQYLLE